MWDESETILNHYQSKIAIVNKPYGTAGSYTCTIWPTKMCRIPSRFDNLPPPCSQKGTLWSCCTRWGPLKLYLYSNFLFGKTAWTIKTQLNKTTTENIASVTAILKVWYSSLYSCVPELGGSNSNFRLSDSRYKDNGHYAIKITWTVTHCQSVNPSISRSSF